MQGESIREERTRLKKNNIYCVVVRLQGLDRGGFIQGENIEALQGKEKKNKKPHAAETVTDIHNIRLAAFEGVTECAE